MVFGVVGAVVVLLAMGLAWAVSPADDGVEVLDAGPVTPADPDDEPAEAPGPSGSPGSGSGDLETVVAEISAWVEEERGLEFEEDPVVELADEGEFQDRLLADFDEDAEEQAEFQAELEALGLIDEGVDVQEELRELLGVGVLGFYDPETKELVVRAGDITPLARITIAHELVHALDDQHFDLDRPEYDDATDEVGTGFSSITEGNATVIDAAYRDTLSDDEEQAATDEERELASGIDPSIPLVLLQLLSYPYELGPPLVEAILEDGGQEGLDAAFVDPPTTSEQILDPQRFLDGEEGIDVPAPTADGEVIYAGAFGALSLAFVLGVDPYDEAVEGWGGDAYVVWTEGEQTCARANIVGDTDADTTEIADALNDWAETQPDAEVAASADFVTFTACT